MANSMSVRVGGLLEAKLALGRLPENAERELADANQRIARALQGQVVSAAQREGRQAGALAKTVTTRLTKVPSVEAGGTRLLGRNKQPAYKLLFGSEFGARTLKQYKPHLGRGSYWFFRTVERNEDRMRREWNKAIDDVVRKFEGA